MIIITASTRTRRVCWYLLPLMLACVLAFLIAAVPSKMAALRRQQHTTDAAQVAQRIKLEARASGDEALPTAVLLLSNTNYEARFEEVISTWADFAGGQEKLVLAALDQATASYFRGRGIKTVRVYPQNMDAEQSVREAVLRAKIEVPHIFLQHGLKVVVAEMDVFCRANPLLLDPGTAEVLTTEHIDSEEVNVGFFVAYPTPRVVDSFRRMRAWATNPGRTLAYCDGAFDQKVMHYAWLGQGALSRRHSIYTFCRYFSQRDQLFDPRKNEPVALERIGFDQIMHWTPDSDPEDWPPRDASTTPTCVHIWSGFGPPANQTRFAYGHGWFPPASEQAAMAALERLERAQDDAPVA